VVRSEAKEGGAEFAGLGRRALLAAKAEGEDLGRAKMPLREKIPLASGLVLSGAILLARCAQARIVELDVSLSAGHW